MQTDASCDVFFPNAITRKHPNALQHFFIHLEGWAPWLAMTHSAPTTQRSASRTNTPSQVCWKSRVFRISVTASAKNAISRRFDRAVISDSPCDAFKRCGRGCQEGICPILTHCEVGLILASHLPLTMAKTNHAREPGAPLYLHYVGGRQINGLHFRFYFSWSQDGINNILALQTFLTQLYNFRTGSVLAQGFVMAPD